MAEAKPTTISVPKTRTVTRQVEESYTEDVLALSLTLTKDEADSLATLLHCHVGGLHRSPALMAISQALRGTDSASPYSKHLVQRDATQTGAMTVLLDLFGLDLGAKPKPTVRQVCKVGDLGVGDRVEKATDAHVMYASHGGGDDYGNREASKGRQGTVRAISDTRGKGGGLHVNWDNHRYTEGDTDRFASSVIAPQNLYKL